MHKYVVGKPYNPKIRRWPETPQYNVRSGHHELVLFLADPTDREVESVRQGPAEFALHVEPPMILLLYRFEPGIPWGDAPFSIHRVPEAERELPASLLTPEARALLHVLLVDASTGLLRAIRAVSLSAQFSAALHGAIRAQAIAEWDPAKYDAKLSEIYNRAQSDALARAAEVRCRGGE
jgi:hypothetical protein